MVLDYGFPKRESRRRGACGGCGLLERHVVLQVQRAASRKVDRLRDFWRGCRGWCVMMIMIIVIVVQQLRREGKFGRNDRDGR